MADFAAFFILRHGKSLFQRSVCSALQNIAFHCLCYFGMFFSFEPHAHQINRTLVKRKQSAFLQRFLRFFLVKDYLIFNYP